MRLFLISTNLETKPSRVYPLGVSRLATVLRQAGHQVEIYDHLAHGGPEHPDLLSRELAAFRPDVVGLSLRNVDNTESHATQTYLQGYQALMATIRQATPAPVVLGGPAYSIFPEVLLKRLCADLGVPGPGERVLLAMAEAWSRGQSLAEVPGVWSRSGDAVRRGSERTLPLADPPAVRRESELVSYYWTHGGSLNVQTRLGCKYGCIYCTYPAIDGPGCVAFHPNTVAQEIAALYQEHGVRHVFLVDSVFNLDPDHALAVADALITLQAPVTWTCFCEPGELREGFLSRLAQAGCTHIEFGTESFSDPVLEAYGKPFRSQDVAAWSRAAGQAGIHQAHFLILGGPGETPATVAESFAFSRGLSPAVFFPYMGMRIFPETPLQRLAIREGRIRPEEDLLEPVFYFSENTSQDWLTAAVVEQAGRDPRWITPEKWKQAESVMTRLRQKGKKGPLWEYLAK